MKRRELLSALGAAGLVAGVGYLADADLAFRTARYCVTERFVIREGVVVECWG